MTSLYHYCLSALAVSGCLRHASLTRPGCSQSLTQGSVFLPVSNTLFITHMRPITCLSFRAIMDLAQKFEGFACDTTISVTVLNLNRKYHILRAKRLTTIFGPTVVLTIMGEGQPWPKYSCLGDIVISLRTPTLNRLIPMPCTASPLQGRMFNYESLPVGNRDVMHIYFNYRLIFRHETHRHGV